MDKEINKMSELLEKPIYVFVVYTAENQVLGVYDSQERADKERERLTAMFKAQGRRERIFTGFRALNGEAY